jgi:hypothetical protein
MGLGLELEALGLADGEPRRLTPRGEAVYDSWYGYGERDAAYDALREGYLGVPAVAALMQGLHGRKAVSVEGALLLLARHGLADADDATWFRSFLQALNDVGIVAYSRKHQTVRVVAPAPAAVEDESEDAKPSVRVIERDRPYSNVRHMRETLRECREHIWWADPHFSRKGLEPLVDEADATRVSEIRILSGPAQVGEKTVKDFEQFQKEMNALGITAEWRVVDNADRDWHDRFVVTKGKAWNVPPVNTLYKGDYSEISETTPPPFERWWAKGKAIGT